MLKKVLAIFLCALMLTAVVPLNAFALEDTVIESADITFKTDIAGLTVNDYKRIIKINSDGLVYDDFNGYDVVFAYEKLDDGFTSKEGYFDEFVAGKTYVFYIYFVPAAGYAFPESGDDIDLTFNADGAEVISSCIDYDYIDGNYENGTYEYYEIVFEATIGEQGFFGKLLTNLNNFFETIVNFIMNIFPKKVN